MQAEKDKITAELQLLKAQVHPHFLFNTLNNIYTLTLMKDDNAPDSIMKLSNIMRYVTDDAMTCVGTWDWPMTRAPAPRRTAATTMLVIR